MSWKKLLNSTRRKPKVDKVGEHVKKETVTTTQVRTQLERDYDRILFSAPVRRLGDKTQVFPLEKNDSIRNRLTHSHEVANLARSIGVTLAFDHQLAFEDDPQATRNIPALLAAVGLAHDLGNPPFGHQGEEAIQSWFKANEEEVFGSRPNEEGFEKFTFAQKNDFLKFEGNAQALRILTRLQILSDTYGLNLTYATMAALMKYPVPSDRIDKEKGVASKKFGFFQSEQDIVKEIWNETGLQEGVRHPLTYVMEACDDIAYSVIDAEDGVKKGIVSFADLIAYLKHHKGKDDQLITSVIEIACSKNKEFRKEELSSAELNDISMQIFRVNAIHQMVTAVQQAFIDNQELLFSGKLKTDLIDVSEAKGLRQLLKQFGRENVYNYRSVLEVELIGHRTIHKLLDIFWSIFSSAKYDKSGKIGTENPYHKYVYSRISENYRRVFENEKNQMPRRYKELQLMTDSISGMTDSYAISLLAELEKYHHDTTSSQTL